MTSCCNSIKQDCIYNTEQQQTIKGANSDFCQVLEASPREYTAHVPYESVWEPPGLFNFGEGEVVSAIPPPQLNEAPLVYFPDLNVPDHQRPLVFDHGSGDICDSQYRCENNSPYMEWCDKGGTAEQGPLLTTDILDSALSPMHQPVAVSVCYSGTEACCTALKGSYENSATEDAGRCNSACGATDSSCNSFSDNTSDACIISHGNEVSHQLASSGFIFDNYVAGNSFVEQEKNMLLEKSCNFSLKDCESTETGKESQLTTTSQKQLGNWQDVHNISEDASYSLSNILSAAIAATFQEEI